jgi:hypothetical protein
MVTKEEIEKLAKQYTQYYLANGSRNYPQFDLHGYSQALIKLVEEKLDRK